MSPVEAEASEPQEGEWGRAEVERIPRRRLHARAYQSDKDLQNPYFQKPPVRRSFSGRGKWYLAVVVVGSFILVGFTPYFRIHDIEVIGVQYANADEIREHAAAHLDDRRMLLLPNRNPLFLNKKHLADDLVESLRSSVSVESLRITTRWPDTAVVTIRERIPSLTWISQDTYFTVDRQGIVSKQIEEETANPEFPRAFDLGNTPAHVGETVIDPMLVEYLFTLRSRIPPILKAPIAYFSVPKESTTELHVRAEEGWDMYFDRSVSLELQLENLQLILDRKFTADERERLHYVDLRYNDRVYYR